MLTDEEARKNIGTNLKRLLNNRGWTQARLAKEVGCPTMTISRIVRGQNMPGIGLLARVAEVLDVSVDRLIHEPSKNNLRQPA